MTLKKFWNDYPNTSSLLLAGAVFFPLLVIRLLWLHVPLSSW